MQFTVLEDFFSKELKSQYCKGLSYNVRPADAVLAELVPQWVEEGKVRLGGVDTPPAGKNNGAGNVH